MASLGQHQNRWSADPGAKVRVDQRPQKREFHDKQERPYLAVELASETCLVIVGLGYWVARVRASVGSNASILFITGCAWLLVAGARELRKYESDPEMSRALNAAALVVGVCVYLLLSAPLLYWGFFYAVRGSVAST